MPGASDEVFLESAALFGALGPVPPEQAKLLGEARELLAGEAAEVLVHRRTLAARTTRAAASVPAWAAGMRPERSVGPFPDLLGRPTWIDVFRPTRQVRLVRTAGGQPLVTLDLARSHLAALGGQAELAPARDRGPGTVDEPATVVLAPVHPSY